MMVLTLLWLPVLIVPLIWSVHGAVALTLETIDYMVWALFAVEYLGNCGFHRRGGPSSPTTY